MTTPTDMTPFLLHSSPIVDGNASPQRWMVILHGIYGQGSNWRTFARALAKERPDWGLLLVDLRMHGQSQGAPPPHTLAAAAEDVLRLIDYEREEGHEVLAVLGHSFGGKVALEMLRRRPELGDVWVIDSSPGPCFKAMQDPDHSVVKVLRVLESLPPDFESRAAFVAELQGRGFVKHLADWLAMNVEASGERYRFLLDTEALRDLLADYFNADLWSVLETQSPPVRFAIASNSNALSKEDQQRLAKLESKGKVQATHLQGSHVLHVDAFDALVELVLSTLP